MSDITGAFNFMPIGQAIKDAREKKKLTREQLAEQLDITPRYLQSLENEGQQPSLQLFIQLIIMFDISVDEYIFPDNQTEKSSLRRQVDKILDTFNDKESVNHAKLGIEILKNDNFLLQFCPEEKYHDIIIKAIDNHNKFKIDESLVGEEILQSKIIRDADKVDIINLLRFETFDTLFKKNNIIDEPISKVVLDAFLHGKQVERKFQVTNMDSWLGNIGYIFDINFIPSFKIIKDNDYVNELFNKTPTEEMERARIFMNKYISDKAEGR